MRIEREREFAHLFSRKDAPKLKRAASFFTVLKMSSAKASPHFSRRRRYPSVVANSRSRCHSAPSAHSTSVVTLSRYQRYTLVARPLGPPPHSTAGSRFHHECFFSPCYSIAHQIAMTANYGGGGGGGQHRGGLDFYTLAR